MKTNSINILCIAFAFALPFLSEKHTLNFKVRDEEGNPIKGVKITTCVETEASLRRWNGPCAFDEFVAKTDSNGEARSRIACHNGDFSVYLSADGFYSEKDVTNRFNASYSMQEKRYVFNEKEKNLSYTMRRIRNPMPMKFTRGLPLRIPLKPGVYPFDLELGDFVAPRGKGKIADMEVVYENAWKTPTNKICKGVLRFPNGGAYLRKKIQSTSFQSEYEANTNETYISEFPFEYQYDKTDSGGTLSRNPIDDSQYMVFRVREQRDENRKLIAANYGKIYGMIKAFGCIYYHNGYFNSLVNSINIEEKK